MMLKLMKVFGGQTCSVFPCRPDSWVVNLERLQESLWNHLLSTKNLLSTKKSLTQENLSTMQNLLSMKICYPWKISYPRKNLLHIKNLFPTKNILSMTKSLTQENLSSTKSLLSMKKSLIQKKSSIHEKISFCFIFFCRVIHRVFSQCQIFNP